MLFLHVFPPVKFPLFHQPIAEVYIAGGAFADGVFPCQNHERRLDDDPGVSREGDLSYVLEIVLELLFPGDVVSAADLRETGQPRAHVVAAPLLLGHKEHIFDQLRPRADDGHLPDEDVEELGQFVQAGRAKEPAVLVQPILVGEQISVRVLFVGHGPELDEAEDAFVAALVLLARALLREEGVAPHKARAEDGQEQEQGRQNDDRHTRQHDVPEAFEELPVEDDREKEQEQRSAEGNCEDLPPLHYSKHLRTTSMMTSCVSFGILLSLGRQSPRAKISAPTALSANGRA